MTDTLDRLDYYRLLGVTQDASADAIRLAYHRFAKKFHPDRHVGAPGAKRRRAEEIFRRGAEAYRVLLDPENRRRYDAGLPEGKLRLTEEAGAPGGGPGRSRRPPKAPILPPQARTFSQKAEELLRQGQRKQALFNLQIALRHAPGHPHLIKLQQKIEAG